MTRAHLIRFEFCAGFHALYLPEGFKAFAWSSRLSHLPGLISIESSRSAPLGIRTVDFAFPFAFGFVLFRPRANVYAEWLRRLGSDPDSRGGAEGCWWLFPLAA